MKGKLLLDEDILKLDSKEVYIVPMTNDCQEEGKAKVEINNGKIKFQPVSGSHSWSTIYKDVISNGTWLDVFEWIEEPKKYSAEEIIKLLGENKIDENDIIYNNEHFKLSKYHFEHAKVWHLIKFAPYIIKKAPKALSFSELLDDKYTDKRIRTEHELISGNYSDLSYLLNNMSRLSNNVQIMKVIKEGKFYIEED